MFRMEDTPQWKHMEEVEYKDGSWENQLNVLYQKEFGMTFAEMFAELKKQNKRK